MNGWTFLLDGVTGDKLLGQKDGEDDIYWTRVETEDSSSVETEPPVECSVYRG